MNYRNDIINRTESIGNKMHECNLNIRMFSNRIERSSNAVHLACERKILVSLEQQLSAAIDCRMEYEISEEETSK